MLRIIKITGSSLQPTYLDGDFVLVSKIPSLLRPIRAGDVIVFQHALYGRLIKLVQRHDRARDEITVTGLQTGSVDSRRFGPIHARDVTGTVIARFRRPG